MNTQREIINVTSAHQFESLRTDDVIEIEGREEVVKNGLGVRVNLSRVDPAIRNSYISTIRRDGENMVVSNYNHRSLSPFHTSTITPEDKNYRGLEEYFIEVTQIT